MAAPDDTSSVDTPRPKLHKAEGKGPRRNGFFASDATATVASPTPPPGNPDVSRIVSEAVRVGYGVIASNLELGRIAADNYHDKKYGAKDASHDLATIGRRLVQLSRDLSTTGFDLIGAVLADENLRKAVARHSTTPPPIPPKTPHPGAPLAVTVKFLGPGAARGSADPATLQQPDAVAMLALPALHGDAGSSITRITFGSTPGEPRGVVAYVTIPTGQAGGRYNGVIIDARSHKSLGALTVRIAA